MEIASVSVSGIRAKASGRLPVTSGTIGATVSFSYDDTWDGMTKTLVWKGSGRTIDDISASGVVPAEVVSEAGTNLYVGVYGTKDGVATPTVWADLGVILEGVDPSGDESTDPSLPVWAQIPKLVEGALEKAKASGAFDGKDGITPERGADYWTPDDIAAIKSYVDDAILGGYW